MADAADLLALHHRLLDGDLMASQLLGKHLIHLINNRLPTRDADLRHDAAVTAFMAYLSEPTKFDPAKGTLRGYLEMSARAKLKNLLRGQTRRQKCEWVAGKNRLRKSVELSSSPVNDLVKAESIAAADEFHRRLLAALDPADRSVAELMRAGVKKTVAYVEALGLTGLTPAEQRKAVKQAKDRVKKACQRLKTR